LDAKRTAAQACITTPTASPGLVTTPGITGPINGSVSTQMSLPPAASDVKAAYEAWLGSAASAVAEGGAPDPTASTTAQQIDRYLQNCPGGFHLPDCGTDVNCQRGEWAMGNFAQVGAQLAQRFQGCSDQVRRKAHLELSAHHDWN